MFKAKSVLQDQQLILASLHDKSLARSQTSGNASEELLDRSLSDNDKSGLFQVKLSPGEWLKVGATATFSSLNTRNYTFC